MISSIKKLPALPLDTVIALLFFSLGAVVGTFYYSAFITAGGKPSFYQDRFGPAVMLACGQGFVNPKISIERGIDEALADTQTTWTITAEGGWVDPAAPAAPLLSDFLLAKRDTFSCSALPPNLPVMEFTKFQVATSYLFFAVASVWKFTGISWSGLAPLFGILFGATAALVYGLFRLGMGRFLASGGALALTTSSFHLLSLPSLRDYTKAPFILALMLVMGGLVTRPLRRTSVLGLSIAYGIIMGLGFGFRTDLLINILPFMLVLFFFLPGSVLVNIKLKAAALTLFFISFFITAWPLITSVASGRNFWHVVILGLMHPFDNWLGVTNSLYEWGHFYQDALVKIVVESYAQRIYGYQAPLPFASQVYDQVAGQYFFEIARNFPADILLRGYASILKILEIPFNPIYLYVPPGISYNWLVNFYLWRAEVLSSLTGFGLFLAGITLLVTSMKSLRKAAFLFLFLLYFAGLLAIQFQERHFFYLEFIGWWSLGFVVQQIVYALNRIAQPDTRQAVVETLVHPKRWWTPSTRHLLGFTIAIVVILASPLFLLRQYQQARLDDLLKTYVSAAKEPLPLQQAVLESGQILMSSSNLSQRISPNSEPTNLLLNTEYLVAEFDSERCSNSILQAAVRYESRFTSPDLNKSLDFSQAIEIYPALNKTSQLFFPVFYTKRSTFKGIEMPPAQANCLIGLYRFKDLSHFPLILTLVLPPNWEQGIRYQTLAENPVDKLLTNLWASPQFMLNQKIEGWTLVGYDVDEKQLVSNEPTSLKLYWQPPPQVEPLPSDNFYHQIANRWVQVIQVQNLIPDGGFEKNLGMTNFPYDIYSGGAETRTKVTAIRNGQSTTVAVLQNTQVFKNSSFASEPIPIKEDYFYLQTGWIQSAGGNAFLGRQWLPSGSYDYVIGGVKPETWTHYAQVIKPPPGANAAQVWLLNFQSIGKVYFDNVILVKLGRLNSSACHASEADANLVPCNPPLLTDPSW